MEYTHFSHNGKLLPADQAAVPLSNIAYSYGFGVYETIRVAGGLIYFLDEHVARLLQSAHIINLEHTFEEAFVDKAVRSLSEKTKAEAYNLKVLLIGGRTAEQAELYITCLNPLFPDRKLYRDGVRVISEQCERLYPQAKSLNMFSSYQAYRHAQANGAYDALLINRDGCITEGTRTNFFGLSGRTLVSPPAKDCLHGVTRHHVIQAAQAQGFTLQEKPMQYTDVKQYDSVFLTSTPSKIMPIRTIDDSIWEQPVSPALRELMQVYEQHIDQYRQAHVS